MDIWQDCGILLTQKRHGERGVILTFLTQNHGKVSGYARDARFLPGCLYAVTWSGRLAQHLGNWRQIEAHHAPPRPMSHHLWTYGLASLLETTYTVLAERDTCPEIYAALACGVSHPVETCVEGVLLFEYHLLSHLGFGLDWRTCAVTGRTEGLCYVSPKTGRAVTAEGATGYETRLLPLPLFFWYASRGGSYQTPSASEILQALDLCTHFLTRACDSMGKSLPMVRSLFDQSCRRVFALRAS